MCWAPPNLDGDPAEYILRVMRNWIWLAAVRPPPSLAKGRCKSSMSSIKLYLEPKYNSIPRAHSPAPYGKTAGRPARGRRRLRPCTGGWHWRRGAVGADGEGDGLLLGGIRGLERRPGITDAVYNCEREEVPAKSTVEQDSLLADRRGHTVDASMFSCAPAQSSAGNHPCLESAILDPTSTPLPSSGPP